MRPHLKKQWWTGQITGEYPAQMGDVLSLYNLPSDEKRPVICLDELPFQMLGEKVKPLEMKSGAVEKFDYEYERKGIASVFVAFEPLTGKRLIKFIQEEPKPITVVLLRNSSMNGHWRK